MVALAYNYNVWFCTARLAFPYHSPTANVYWVACDVVSDVINLVDICVWQPRLQFVKGGDIIVSPAPPPHASENRPLTASLCPPQMDGALTKIHYRKSPRFKVRAEL